jgi:hypothetical protein
MGSRLFACQGFVPSWGPPERSGITYLRHDRTLVSRVLQLMSRNPIILMGQKGWQICVGMGPYRRISAPVQLETTRTCHAEKVRLVQWRLGEQKPRLSNVSAMYRQTRRQDSRHCGLLAGAESLRSWHVNLARAVQLKGGLFSERPYIGVDSRPALMWSLFVVTVSPR